MRNKKRRYHDTVATALKQASVIKTLAMAASGFKNGTIRVIAPPLSNLKRKANTSMPDVIPN
ncbi:MAG: hypothetical protein RLZZ321_2067 [Bacteroidota bacterium]|jgi:hypothetical protein